MAKTTNDFIKNSFSPIIATLSSPKVESVVSKNYVTFPELLQPFGFLDSEGHFREPGGSQCTVKNLKLVIRDVNWKPLPPTEARRQLNNAVLYNFNENTSPKLIDDHHNFNVPKATPWFDAWKETYLEVQFPSDHEFTKHFISCIIVATTLEDNIIDVYNTLNQQYAQLQNVTPPKLPKWFNNSVLKSYLLLHDVSMVPKEKADASFELMKQTFGASNCFMLSINSRQHMESKLPIDYWSQYVIRPSQDITNKNDLTLPPTQIPTALPEPLVVQLPHNAASDTNMFPTTVSEDSHPLTTNENDVYDNANSLMSHSFSGSAESVNVPGRLADTEVHGAALNVTDVDAIKEFLSEYTSRALLPHIEKLIAQLTEIVANKKGVSRSLLSATKRWFTTGKSGTTTINNTVIYSSDCPELQLRRLGDLWFMCGQWHRAYDAYHTAKREFYADSAWLCYAGALEMAAVSAFMAGEANRKTFAYMEESIVTYLNTCRMVQYAVRATLLSVPCLINAGMYGEAAKQLIRMTSEDSDLRSAMLLEQAALCFLLGPSNKIMSRKYAFHMVLAGHRFSKAGQKKHAYRCYNQAYQVYKDSNWRLSTDHVQFALGRLAGALKMPREAALWLAAPLAPYEPSHQEQAQQDAFMREFLLAHQQLVENSDEYKEKLPTLPVPLLMSEQTAVLCVGPAPLSSPGRVPATSISFLGDEQTDSCYWSKLEEAALQVAQGSVPMIFKPTYDLYSHKADSNPVVPRGEPLQISVCLKNPLKVALLLKDLEILWRFSSSADSAEVQEEAISNESRIASGLSIESNVIHSQKIKSLLLEGQRESMLTFGLTPLKLGHLDILGVAYKLMNAGEGRDIQNGVTVSGKLNLQADASCNKRLHITIIDHAPCLQMTFTEINTDVVSGELITLDVDFRNVGPAAMNNLHVAVSHPECMCVATNDDQIDNSFKELYEDKYKEPADEADERALRAYSRNMAARRRVSAVCCGVSAGGATCTSLALRPHTAASALYLLAYYETGLKARPYRLLRHVFRFTVTDAVEMQVTPRRSLGRLGDIAVENLQLAVEVKNISNEKDERISIEVLEASLLSRQWKLTDLTKASDVNNLLVARERMHLVFKGVRILDELQEGHIEHSHLKVKKSDPDNSNYKFLYNKFVTDNVTSILDNIDFANNEQKTTGLIQSMFILRWKSYNKKNNKTVIGQHCLWLECFSKSLNTRSEKIIDHSLLLDELDSKVDIKNNKISNENNNMIMMRLEHSKCVDHDFNVRKLCIIPVAVNIVNCYGEPVQVFIHMSQHQNRESSGVLGWTGALNNGPSPDSNELGISVRLEKFETRRVQMRALCVAPGTYTVDGAFSATCAPLNNTPSKQFMNNSSLLIVKQST
ncbi:trafficking protein particle complex subunit 8 isoform X2 [Leptidea sinapis]|uniref:trafficking protein particle complex subunit 8 isoform X2 n=1 Tax=Leptidea sinapis TaxID=189913 RepID=UPI0021C4880F|nr:trafficking protein particle complex subunit 8 isoform X2 [Leptidea sinapis]